MSLLLAASTQRTIGWILAILVTVPVVFLLVRRAFVILFRADPEVGSEIELAPNRAPAVPDEFLEGTRLDRSLGAGLVTLALIGVILPLYWLGEPGRLDGALANGDRIFTDRGGESYEENCTACHGPEGTAGAASFTLTDAGGNFVSQVSWAAPALNTVLTRFSEEEVRHVLNFGRNGVMPAWGAPGGGPMTEQQVDNLIVWMRSIQLEEEQIQANVREGAQERKQVLLMESGMGAEEAAEAAADFMADVDAMLAPLRADAEETLSARISGVERLPEGPDRVRELGRIQTQIEAFVAADLLDLPVEEKGLLIEWGEVLFTNRADSGVYGCARCHTPGYSYQAVEQAVTVDGQPVLDEYDQGGGAFGPSLTGGATITRFIEPSQQQGFIAIGSETGVSYGSTGRTSQGSGQMPGFGARSEGGNDYNALLTEPEIAAIVAYERSL